jgi:translation initiation factor 1 (eIF-1/SUI1)
LSKKFACSCSATDDDKILVQGDFFEDIKEILINDYKVKKKFILDND